MRLKQVLLLDVTVTIIWVFMPCHREALPDRSHRFALIPEGMPDKRCCCNDVMMIQQ